MPARIAMHASRRNLECPREYQRNRKAKRQQRENKFLEQVWQSQDRGHGCRDLQQQPGYDEINTGDANDLAALQLPD